MSQDNPSPPPSSREPRLQPFWKVQTIRLLRGTIGVLQGAVDRLESQTPSEDGGVSLWWRRSLNKLRLFLPSNVSNNLSDTALTGILAGVAVFLVWGGVTVFSPQRPVEVASQPPVPEVSQPAIEEEIPAVKETPPDVTVTTPDVVPIPEEVPPPVETPAPQPEPEPEPEPEPTPAAPVILTPEQALIAAIENQVAQVSNRYGAGIINSVQANFGTSTLIIKLGDNWYSFKKEQQDKLAAQMFDKAKELDFSYLEITDNRGVMLARSPIVGTEMVIFKRQQIVVSPE